MVCGNGYEVSDYYCLFHSSAGKNKTCLLNLIVANWFALRLLLWGYIGQLVIRVTLKNHKLIR